MSAAEVTTTTSPGTAPSGPVPDSSAPVEVAALRMVQRGLAKPVPIGAARALSWFGEHSLGWLGLGLLGAAVDCGRRRDWLIASAGVVGAHGLSIVIKRVVRRPRPNHPDVRVLVGTPSKLSFPSSHAASTTAAAVLYAGLTGQPAVTAVVPPMLVSRMVLGVHYPSDVLAGAALGAVVGGTLRRWLRGAGRFG